MTQTTIMTPEEVQKNRDRVTFNKGNWSGEEATVKMNGLKWELKDWGRKVELVPRDTADFEDGTAITDPRYVSYTIMEDGREYGNVGRWIGDDPINTTWMASSDYALDIYREADDPRVAVSQLIYMLG